MHRLKPSMHDDRGQRVRALRPGYDADWPTAGDVRMDELRARIARVIRTDQFYGAFGGARVVFLAIVLGGLLGVLGALVFGITSIVAKSMMHVSGPLTFVLVRELARRRSLFKQAEVVLEDGLCGSCGYNLHGTIPQPDGCAVCPECGAAWSTQRFKRHAAFDPRDTVDDARPRTWLPPPRGGDGIDRFAKDDSGADVMIVSARLRHALHTARNESHARRVREAADELYVVGQWARIVLVCVPFAAFGALLALGTGMSRIGQVFVLLGSLTIVVLAFRAETFTPTEEIIRSLRNRGLCPTCGDDLTPLTPDDTGRVRCTRCGARWKR
jgi:DNA-directed RNA polymerase subunit RPC12/RpoP